MYHRAKSILLFPVIFVMAVSMASADVRLPHIFGSHMVLQQDKPIIVWGWAVPGENVAVDLGSANGKAVADDKGEWKITLPAMKAGGPAMVMHITAANKITLDDVLIGEVWLCSGQSNMEFGIGLAGNAKAAIADADQPEIRLMKVQRSWKPEAQADMSGEWKVCTPASVSSGGWNGFSAVGYFFGRQLHDQLHVPVGLIDATWGGTKIESWTCPQGFAQVPALAKENEQVQLSVPGSPEHDKALSAAIESMDAWSVAAKKALADHVLPPPLPGVTGMGSRDLQSATALFNGMIYPLCPFPIRGAIWYQGEANHDEGMYYTQRMKALIGGWRTIWGEGDFPFYFVQIAPYNYNETKPYLPEFWEAQAAAEKVIPNTGMVVVNDIGNLADIHPKNKLEVSRRLALRALSDTYGKTDLLSRSPTFKSMAAEGASLRVTFDNTGAGLQSRDGKPISWFEIADADEGEFKKATATIDGASVLLTADGVKHPVAVRFAWAMLAVPNLENSAHLPASAFRAGTLQPHDSITRAVPELKNYQMVYDLDLSKLGEQINFTTDNHAAITQPFDRVAYGLELQSPGGKSQWVYVSMDTFTADIAKIAVPTAESGGMFQQNLVHMNVFSNVAGIVTGENLGGGNIEFWPNNYQPFNSAKVPNAADTTFDFGDQPTDLVDGYGSMQIHNHDAKQTLFAVNHWKAGDAADIGIGNAPVGNPDWTFARNAASYTAKRLRVFVRLKSLTPG
jgi:sialate O-acetylesterase